MKNIFPLLCILCGVIVYESCSSDTHKTEPEMSQTNEQMSDVYISGEVQEVRQGKDGYTAKILTKDHQIYFATISRANLKDKAAQYKTVVVGDVISVKGDIWKMGEETHVTVRDMK